MSDPIQVTRDDPFPDDIGGLFLATPPADPTDVVVVINGRRHEWPWRQAQAFAVELARFSGYASIRDPDPLAEEDNP